MCEFQSVRLSVEWQNGAARAGGQERPLYHVVRGSTTPEPMLCCTTHFVVAAVLDLLYICAG